MRPTAALFAALLVAVGAVTPAVGSVHAVDTPGGEPDVVGPVQPPTANDSNASAGSYLAGALATQQAAVGGDLAARKLGVQLASGATVGDRVAVLAELRIRTEQRQRALERRRAELRTGLANGSVGIGEFAHAMASLRTGASVNAQLADRGRAAANDLPTTVAEAYDVTPERFEALGADARQYGTELTGRLLTEGLPGLAAQVRAVEDVVAATAGIEAVVDGEALLPVVDPGNLREELGADLRNQSLLEDSASDLLGNRLDDNETSTDGVTDRNLSETIEDGIEAVTGVDDATGGADGSLLDDGGSDGTPTPEDTATTATDAPTNDSDDGAAITEPTVTVEDDGLLDDAL